MRRARVDGRVFGLAMALVLASLGGGCVHEGDKIDDTRKNLGDDCAAYNPRHHITISPDSGQRWATLDILISGVGTSFNKGTIVDFYPTGVIDKLRQDVYSTTSMRIRVYITGNAQLGMYKLRVIDGGVYICDDFEVTAPPTPSVTFGQTWAYQGSTTQFHALGVNTHFDESLTNVEVAPSGQGVTVSLVGVKTLTQATVEVVAEKDAVVQDYTITLTTQLESVSNTFAVYERSLSLDPDWGYQRSEITVEGFGVNTAFEQGVTTASVTPSGQGVTVAVQSVEDVDRVLLDVGIAADAVVGDYEISVTTGDEEVSDTFTVVERSVSITPDQVYQGDTIGLVATGTNTNFIDGTTTVTVDPPSQGVLVTMDSVTSSTLAALSLDVEPGTPLGDYVITLQTGTELVSDTITVNERSIALVPSSLHQLETSDVAVSGVNTHFQAGVTQVEVEPSGAGVEASIRSVSDQTHLTLRVVVSEEAFVGSCTIRLRTGTERAEATLDVLPGIPRAELSPSSLVQGSVRAVVRATGHFVNWDGTTQVAPSGGCSIQVKGMTVLGPKLMDMVLTVPLTQASGPCELSITTPGLPSEDIIVVLQVVSAVTHVVPSGQTTGYLNGVLYYSVDLDAGDVLRSRALRGIATTVDPVLSVLGPEGDPDATPLATNDDESVATYNSLVVYQAPETGTYYLRITDRLGFNTGQVTLDLGPYAPEGQNEAGSGNDTFPGEAMTERLLRGGFGTGDGTDIYSVTAPTGLPRVAVQVIAQDVSPYETSGSDTRLLLYNSAQEILTQADQGTYTADPVLYVDAPLLSYILVANQGLVNTTYWLNIRPHILINEVFHDEDTEWLGGYVELFGEPGQALTGCHLLGKAHDGTDATQLFDIDISEYVLNPAGFVVIAHDDLVPGTGAAYIKPELSISDPGGVYTSIGVFLECTSQQIDAVCYRGSSLAGCEGSEADDDPMCSLGRGFGIDTDENGADFMVQIEPSPWARNLTEVPR